MKIIGIISNYKEDYESCLSLVDGVLVYYIAARSLALGLDISNKRDFEKHISLVCWQKFEKKTKITTTMFSKNLSFGGAIKQ